LFEKISANDGAMIARNPNSARAHGACSRELPQTEVSYRPRRRIERAIVPRLSLEYELLDVNETIGFMESPNRKKSFSRESPDHGLDELVPE
jgi:hypothetical protein